ncbi:hypothetical protein HDU97_008271 [Phlyctochytrium planicorne]|nr:hypothetical protein HDU97_008271 [Phlyctochytrium planicorne]
MQKSICLLCRPRIRRSTFLTASSSSSSPSLSSSSSTSSTLHFQQPSLPSRSPGHYRPFSTSQASLQADSHTFESIGAPERIVRNLNEQFNVSTPTSIQKSFFPAILSHRDVILKDTTGSGKTFGLLAAVLSKKQAVWTRKVEPSEKNVAEESEDIDGIDKPEFEQERFKKVRYLSTLFVVPTPELALQVYGWAKSLLKGVAVEDIPKHVQCIVPQSSLEEQLKLASTPPTGPPRILVGTPRRILDLIEAQAIDLTRIQTVVLDEVDHLVRIKKRFETVKEKINREKHPLYTELLMEKIVLARRNLDEVRSGLAPNAPIFKPLEEKSKSESLVGRKTGKLIKNTAKQILASNPPTSLHRLNRIGVGPEARRLQVIVCSATVNNNLRRELERMRGWLVDPLLIDDQGRHASPSAITHHALIVDPITKSSRNILTHEQEDALKIDTLAKAAEDKGKPLWLQRREEPALEDDDQAVIRVVARVLSRLYVKRGLLFLNSNISVVRVVEKLNRLGVKAGRVQDEVDFVKSSSHDVSSGISPQEATSFFSGKNNLLVVTEHTARGLDLPEVSHVIILGPPSSPASYLHMSGRVGRFGRPGSAITILGGGRFEGKMLDMLKLLQVSPTPLEPHVADG